MKLKFISKKPINKGWSGDKKYCVTDENSTQYFLRISPLDELPVKESEFKMMKQLSSIGVPMCKYIEFGTCQEGVYSIESWIDGKDIVDIISTLSDVENYLYGLEAG